MKLRRIADREARRTRRRQARQRSLTFPKSVHDDGMSSDDEESKSDIVKFQNDRGEDECQSNFH